MTDANHDEDDTGDNQAGDDNRVATRSSRSGRLRWAVLGAVITLLAAGAVFAAAQAVRSRYEPPSADLFGPEPTGAPSPTVEPGADITGPLSILLVGIDPRANQPDWKPNADAVLIMHVPAGLDRAYLFSLPRDLLVDVPAFPEAGFGGLRTKLTHAMSYGSVVPGGGRPDVAQGFRLLASTVSGYTGITRFDAGAVLNFRGLSRLVDAVGGVDMVVDQRVVSQHREPDGDHRRPGYGGYVGPQMVYEPGPHHFTGWQALDYARQRYTDGGDYARQRHQQQLVKALMGRILDQDMARDPVKLDRVLRALGDTLVFDGRGHEVIDFGYALREVRAESVTLVGLPGASVGVGGGYLGEELKPVAARFLAAVRSGQPADVAAVLARHPELLHAPTPPR